MTQKQGYIGSRLVRLILVLATIVCLSLAFLAYSTSASRAPDRLALSVEPHVVSADDVVRVTLVSTPSTLPTVVIRLEGAGFASEYYTLTQGSTATINLEPLSLSPGLYYIAVYDSPGGVLLYREPILVVSVKLVLNPMRPTLGKPFKVTVYVEPVLPGISYTLYISLDGKTVLPAKPGDTLSFVVKEKGKHKLCVSIVAHVNATDWQNDNIYCKVFTPNVPPRVSFNITLEGGLPVLTASVIDPDGFIVIANYTCKDDNIEIRGLLSEGLNQIPLAEFQGKNFTVTCTITAIDDAGAVARAEHSWNLATLYEIVRKGTEKTRKGPTRSGKPGTITSPPPRVTTPTSLPLQLFILPLAVLVAGLGAYMVRRYARSRQEGARSTIETKRKEFSKEVAELRIQLDKLEVQLGEVIGGLGELRGEIDEIKSRVQALDERLKELEEKFKLLSRRGGR